jgi:iron complex outermembrane receptor protein
MAEIQNTRLVVAAWLLAATTAHSQVANQSSSDSSASTDEIPEILVTARKATERTQDVPMSVSAFSGDFLQQAQITSTADLSTIVSGLLYTHTVGNTQPALRGVTSVVSDASQDPNVALYIDGFYVSGQQNAVMDLPDVSHIEVLKGPQGTLFGKNATGGAIQVFTLDPEFQFSGRVSVGGGSYDSQGGGLWTTKGFFTGPISDKLAASVTFSYTGGEGYYHNVFNDQNCCNNYDYLIRTKLLYQVSDSTKFIFSATLSQSNDPALGLGTNPTGLGTVPSLVAAGSLPPTPIPRLPWQVAANQSPNETNQQLIVNLRGETDLGFAQLTSMTGFQKAWTRQDAYLDQTGLQLLYLYTSAPTYSYSQEFDLRGGKGPLSWVGGLYYSYEHPGNQEIFPGIGENLDGQVTSSAPAVFGQANYDLTNKLTATAGVRYSYETRVLYGTEDLATGPIAPLAKKSWDSTTPLGSLRYKFTPDLMTYFTYSEGFKSGNFVIGSLSTTPVQPETLKSYEVGLKIDEHWYSLSADTYYYDYRNLQVEAFNGMFEDVTNAPKARINGFELDGNVAAGGGFRVTGNLSYIPVAKYIQYPGASVVLPNPAVPFGLEQTDINASGDRLVRAPRFTSSLTPSYTRAFNSGTFDALVTGNYDSGYALETGGRLSVTPYMLFNAKISWSVANSGAKFSIWVNNITNKAISSGYVSSPTADWLQYDPPRIIGATFDYRF